MSWIYRISMKMKLFIALLPLLLALIWLGGSGIAERIAAERQMDNMATLTQLAIKAGGVVHELQKERGMSAGYLGAKGQGFRDELTAQRQLTDRALEVFDSAIKSVDSEVISGQVAEALNRFKQTRQQLSGLRQQVSDLAVETNNALTQYTQNVTTLLNIVADISHLSPSGEIVNQLAGYFSLLNAKEQAGIERALLSNIFSANQFAAGQFQRLSNVVGKQEAWLTAARRFLTPAQSQALDAALAQPKATEALALREAAMAKADVGGFDVNATRWFDIQTQRINILKSQEDAAANTLLDSAARLSDEARTAWMRFLAISLTALLIALAIAIVIARSIHRQLQNTLREIAEMEGDLTRRLTISGTDELSALNRAYNHAIENIQHIVSEIKSGATVLRHASANIADGNQNLAQRTDEQAASLVETAASMEQISTTINLTADSAREAEKLTVAMQQEVSQANTVAAQASQSMEAIRASSEQISSIIKSIDDISFQTNLLALNAAVEAARAGELGRGFAVVASEVRNLSQRCATQAHQIRELVNENMAKIGEGVDRVTASGKALQQAAEQSDRMRDYISDIARAAEEQSLGVAQVHLALSQLEQVTQQNAALVSQAASESHSLDQQSEAMTQLVDRFVA
ncbi:methyl-accepting chemotaxis protein [Atlantibacter hermannii]|uniref:methyl-accepting chemotaxis protein n=1 Tax=Atlantibacter hermannii TaxID=565 RepID=UPI0028B13179|nr:nitrate- and nitrite sensing domain-containing protein [Atlantibacter hermannii]